MGASRPGQVPDQCRSLFGFLSALSSLLQTVLSNRHAAARADDASVCPQNLWMCLPTHRLVQAALDKEADVRQEELDDASAGTPVSRLVLVVHGIGQKLEAANIAQASLV